MLIKDSFQKNIFRDIDPVVKADNDDHLANELDEFVVTNEIKQRLYAFFDEYNDPGSSCNGAWISGFFGSGKSHLLKVMAVMMENRNVMGIGAMDRLLPMFDDEPSLKGAIQHSAELHPSESVLFNIDSYAPNQGQAETGALLEAFIKAFNHHCGYFDGGQLHIAAMERELDNNGHYQDFRSAIERICGKPWEVVRKSALVNEVKISHAYDEALGNPAGMTTRVISNYRENYKPDIRGFATTVNEYIEGKGKGFRLNFFVDEVGQFIANNTQLMVNLQSVVEELNIQCGGNSWVIVTSQEDINSVIGETTKENANDFSKIQGRFGVKMPLSSSEAGEVIRDRLLAKKPETRDEFDALYYKYKDDFGVLFDFTGGDRKYRNYKDSDDFFRTYPFVPYQFDVFSSALRSLSDKNVFQGKHNSTGARSMLGVFQDVAESICDHDASTEEGTLAPFDMMFEGLRTSMRTEIYAAVSEAERNLSDETAIRVLKALLLVKYCDEINATAANLRVLLYGAFTENAEELQRKVQDALDLLESQVYIRRNGDSYEYLTNEEKDVENDIHNIVVSESDSHKEIADILHDIIGMYKVTYKNGAFSQSYSYDLAIDGDFQAQKKNDLSVNVVTAPQATGLVDVPHTAPRTLTVFLSGADAFLGELRIFLQTESYARQNSGASDMKAAIIADKRAANRERRKRLQAMFGELLENASYYASSTEVTQDLTGDGKAQ
ncbi:MAG: BREX system P-loop protein BrxC, partial [Coriobacteriales bacterium]